MGQPTPAPIAAAFVSPFQSFAEAGRLTPAPTAAICSFSSVLEAGRQTPAPLTADAAAVSQSSSVVEAGRLIRFLTKIGLSFFVFCLTGGSYDR